MLLLLPLAFRFAETRDIDDFPFVDGKIISENQHRGFRQGRRDAIADDVNNDVEEEEELTQKYHTE